MPEPVAATLRDVSATPNPTVTAPPEPAAKPAAAAPAAPAPDAEAAEIGRLLLESGYTKSQLNDLMAAPSALQTMRYLIQNNPGEFLNLVERADPKAGEKFLSDMADTYVKRYAPREPAPAAPGVKGSQPSDALMAEVESLREKVNASETREQQRAAAATLAQTRSRYDARVDDLFNGLKDVNLTKSEQRALRAQLNEELASDQQAVQRVSNGNFVDVPHKFKSILDTWSGDRTAAAAAAKAARDGVSSRSNELVLDGVNMQIPAASSFDGSWDDTEAALAEAIQKTSR